MTRSSTNAGSAKPAEIEDVDEQLEIAAGRRIPFTQVGDWVALAPGLSPQAKALYWHLAMHVSMTREDDWVWPSQEVLAKWLGFNRVQSITRYVEELEAIGAVDREIVRYAGGMRQRCRYTVHGTPPEDFTGPQSLKEFYARRKAELAANPPRPRRRKKPAGAPGVAVERNTGTTAESNTGVAPESNTRPASDPQPGVTPDPQAKKEDVVQPDERERDEPSAGAGGAGELAAAASPADSGTGKPARLMTKAQQAAAQKAAKIARDAELDKAAAEDAKVWWEAADRFGPWAGSSGAFVALRGMIRRALVAGYTRQQVRDALKDANTRFPAAQQWQRSLAKVSGHQVPGQRPAGPAPMYQDSQYQRSVEPAPEMSPEEIDRLLGRTGTE